MAEIGKGKQSPPSASVSVSLQDIYESLCPKCRRALLDLLTGRAEATGLRGMILRQLEGKPDGP